MWVVVCREELECDRSPPPDAAVRGQGNSRKASQNLKMRYDACECDNLGSIPIEERAGKFTLTVLTALRHGLYSFVMPMFTQIL